MAERKSLGAIKYNAPPWDLHSLELYVTEGGITMCFPFVIFFLQHLVLALSGLPKPFLQLLFLETDWWYFVIWKSLIHYKQNTVWCIVLEVRKLLHQKKSTYNGRLRLPKNLACCTGFSLNCCENADGIVNGRGSSSGRTDAPKESAYGACSANVPHQVCACLPWGLPALRPWAEGRFGTVYTTWPSIQTTFHHLWPADAKQ